MCTHIDYKPVKYAMQQCSYITKIPSYFDGISAAMNSLPCWLDADAESPDCNDVAKSCGQLV